MPTAPDLPAGLLAYLTARAEQHEHDIEQAWPQLLADIEAFHATHRDDPGLPQLLARLIYESVVAAFVRGAMHAAGLVELPASSVMLHRARETTHAMPDIYPAFAILDGRTDTGA